MKHLAPDLTDDDLKVIKHLKSINKLFKTGRLTINQLFIDNGTLTVTIIYDEKEYEIQSFPSIICDGGDPDRTGEFGIREQSEFIEMLTEHTNTINHGNN